MSYYYIIIILLYFLELFPIYLYLDLYALTVAHDDLDLLCAYFLCHMAVLCLRVSLAPRVLFSVHVVISMSSSKRRFRRLRRGNYLELYQLS